MGEQELQMFARALEAAQPGAGQTIMALAASGDPRAQEAIMMLFQIFVQAESQQGPGAGEMAVVEAMIQIGLLPGGPAPQGAPAPPPAPGPGGAPMPMPGGPGVPPEMGGAPVPMDPAAQGVPPEMAQGQPTQGPPPQQEVEPRRVVPKKKKAPPKYQLPPLEESRWKKKAPSIDHVYRVARAGWTMWRARNDRVEEDVACWKGEMASLHTDGTESHAPGRLVHQRLTPYTLVEGVTTQVTWQNDRVEMDMPFRADDDDHINAAQAVENWLRTQREHDSRKWRSRAEIGDPQPPLERVEAQGMALLGGVGWYWEVRPKDEAYPFCDKYVPWNELYPVGSEITRQYIVPLAQLRAESPEVDEYYEGYEGDDALMCRVIGWCDNQGYRHGLCWQEEGAGWSFEPVDGKARDRWIKKPDKVLGLGFPFYNLRIAMSAPGVDETSDHYRKWVGVGILTRAVPHFKLVNMVGEFALKGFFRNVAPPTLQTHQPGTDLNKVPTIDLDPEARNFGFNGDKVETLGMAGTGSPDGQTTLNMLSADQADLAPPVMRGARAGNSGFQQMQAQEAAQGATVSPIMDAMERMYEDKFRQRAMLALRFGKNAENADIEYFSEYPMRDYRKGGYSTLKPKDIELAGVDVEVRYKRLSPAEEAAQATMLVQLVNAHLMSTEEALKRRGVREPEREWLKILKDGAMMNPRVLMSLVGTAILESGDEMLINAWEEAGMLEALKGGGGSQPAQPGVASAAGTASPNVPADVSQPGASNAYAA